MTRKAVMTDEKPPVPVRSKAGGFRPGSGRKVGTLNKSTLARQKAVANQVEAALAAIPDDKIDGMTAVGVMETAMHGFLRAGNVLAAVSIARDLAPYQASKHATVVPIQAVPVDLLPDPPPTPDEPGPPTPIL
jgi:hypothetical protein